MYNSLVMYRNELKNRIIPKYKIIGITSEIILSKELFSKNKDLSGFLEKVYSVTYKDYVFKSRTTIMARTCRLVYDSEEEQFEKIKKELNNFVSDAIDIYKNEEKLTNEKNPFSGWLK